MNKWVPVVHAHDCDVCECCEEPICPHCETHYAECDCPGPHQDDEYEYDDDYKHARLLESCD